MTSKKLLVFPTFLGGRWGEGELISLNSDKQATTLKAFHLMEPLNASIGSLTVDPQGVIYGVMSTTFTYDANNHKVQLPSGAICRISPSGATELVYALNSGGPGQALQWHAGALHGVGGKALYRLAPSSPGN